MKPALPTFALLAFLAACNQHDAAAPEANGNAQASAEGRAEEGKISVKGPGVDLTFSLPKAMRGEAKAARESKVLYPGATIGGLALVGTQGKADKPGDSEVEFRLATADPIDKVTAWYRDPARAKDIKVTGITRQGDETVITGSQAREVDTFKLRLSPRPGGGTDGRLTIHHKD